MALNSPETSINQCKSDAIKATLIERYHHQSGQYADRRDILALAITMVIIKGKYLTPEQTIEIIEIDKQKRNQKKQMANS